MDFTNTDRGHGGLEEWGGTETAPKEIEVRVCAFLVRVPLSLRFSEAGILSQGMHQCTRVLGRSVGMQCLRPIPPGSHFIAQMGPGTVLSVTPVYTQWLQCIPGDSSVQPVTLVYIW